MKSFYAFIGCLLAAILAMYAVNEPFLGSVFSGVTIILSGIIFGSVAGINLTLRNSQSVLQASLGSGLLIAAIIFAFGILAVLGHSLSINDMLIHTAAMGFVGFASGLGFYLGKYLHA